MTVLKAYKRCVKQQKEGDVMGVVRTLFPNIKVETFIENRKQPNTQIKK